MKNRWPGILALLVLMAGGILLFFILSRIISPLSASNSEAVHTTRQIENALLELKHNVRLSSPHLIFKVVRPETVRTDASVNSTSARLSKSWAQGDRIIEFVNVGGELVYSIPIRWTEDNTAGPTMSKIETNVPGTPSGDELYSTSQQECASLKEFLKTRTPDMAWQCSIRKDRSGRIAKELDYLDGSLSLPQKEWGGFVWDLFAQVYGSNEPIYMEKTNP
jgi:hypothetical protein